MRVQHRKRFPQQPPQVLFPPECDGCAVVVAGVVNERAFHLISLALIQASYWLIVRVTSDWQFQVKPQPRKHLPVDFFRYDLNPISHFLCVNIYPHVNLPSLSQVPISRLGVAACQLRLQYREQSATYGGHP